MKVEEKLSDDIVAAWGTANLPRHTFYRGGRASSFGATPAFIPIPVKHVHTALRISFKQRRQELTSGWEIPSDLSLDFILQRKATGCKYYIFENKFGCLFFEGSYNCWLALWIIFVGNKRGQKDKAGLSFSPFLPLHFLSLPLHACVRGVWQKKKL